MRRSREKYLLYIGVCGALLPILLFRDFTPLNELRYLSIAEEALRNHTFFTFTNHGEFYADKPPLYLWIIMLGKWLFGKHVMCFLALFSLIPALIIVRTMDHWVSQEMDNEHRALARLMLLTSGLFIGASFMLRMDMLMCMFIVLALHAFWQMLKEPEHCRRSRWLFPLYVFLALFTKGPLGILIPLCVTTVFLAITKRIRLVPHYWGGRTWGILTVCVTLWLGAVYTEGGSEYLHNLLFHQTIDRAVNSFHHQEPFYYYLGSFWYSLAPWSVLVVGVIASALHARHVCSDLQRFFLTTGLTIFVLLSCISSKIQIYLLPALPFFIYAAGMFLPYLKEHIWLKITIGISAAIFAAALPAFGIIASVHDAGWLHPKLFYVAAFVLTISGIQAIRSLFQKKEEGEIGSAIRRIGTGLLCAICISGCALPQLNQEISYRTLCDRTLQLARQHETTRFLTWHIHRSENMDVYLHHPVQVVPDDEIPSADVSQPTLLMLRKQDIAYFQGCEIRTCGRYAVVVLLPAKYSERHDKDMLSFLESISYRPPMEIADSLYDGKSQSVTLFPHIAGAETAEKHLRIER